MQVYIPYYSHCEAFTCGPHAYPFRGRCLVKERLVADPSQQPFPGGTTRFFITVTLQPLALATDRTKLAAVAEDLGRASKLFLEAKSDLTETGVVFGINRVNVSVVSSANGSKLNRGTFLLSLRVDLVVRYGSLSGVVLLSESLTNKTVEFARGSELLPQTVVVSNLLVGQDNQACPNSTTKHLRNQTLKIDDADAYFLQTQTTFYNLENIGFELLTFPAENSTPFLLQVVVCELETPIDCQGKGYLHLNASSFMVTNDSLVIILSGDEFNESQFVVFENGSAIVCSVYNSTYAENIRTSAMISFDFLEKTISTATVSISMASLVVVLVTYSLLPQLRNVPGVIVMSYSGSLLAFDALSLLAKFPEGWLCVLWACLSHVAILSSFLWKSALSFDLVFMLRLKSIKNSSHASRVMMLNRYSVVGWLVPAVFVLFLWLLDHFQVYAMHYGSRALGLCWMQMTAGNFYLVVVPLGIAWLFNIVCFTLALHLVCRNGRLKGRGVRTRTQWTAERRRLMTYARISILMGCTWLLCFVAMALDLKELWLAHIVLNGSQGVYLLLCFVLKRRVCTMLKERLSGARGRCARAMTVSVANTGRTAVPVIDISPTKVESFIPTPDRG